MSFLIGEIVGSIKGDDAHFRRTVAGVKQEGARAQRDLTRNFDSIGRSMRRTGGIMTATLTLPMVMGMRQAVNESALLEGALAKFDVVFGDMAEETRAWVDEFREGVPLSRREIVQSAAAMQDLLVPMGVARDEATEMTKEWMNLAAALSAFNDVPVDHALEAIRSGIAGQSRPLREFGIDVRETALQQRALEMGLIAAGEQMNDQVRQQALLAQAYANSKDAVDGYEDQLGTTLMVQQEMNATWKDTLATIGQDLQPMYTSLMGSVTDLLRSFNELDDSQRQNIIRMGLIVSAAGPMIVVLGQVLIWTRRVTVAMRSLNAAMLLNPWVAAAAAVAALTTVVIRSNNRLARQRDLIKEVLSMDPTGSRDELDRNQEAISAVIGQMEKLRRQHETMGVEGTEAAQKQLKPLQEQLDKLIEQRQEIGSLIVEQRKQADAADESGKANADAVDEITRAVESYKRAVREVRPVDEIIDAPIRGLEQAFEGIDITPFDIDISPQATMDTIKGLQEAHAAAEKAMTEATTQEERERLHQVMQGYERRLEEMQDFEEGSRGIMQIMGDNMESEVGRMTMALATLASEGDRSFSSLAGSFVKMAKRMIAANLAMAVAEVVKDSFSKFGILGLVVAPAAGAAAAAAFNAIVPEPRALGGPVHTGSPYMVGERGPEMFVPSSHGTIIPNHQLLGGGNRTAIINLKSVNEMDSRTIWEANRRYEVSL